MNAYLSLFLVLIIGFIVYVLIRDKLFYVDEQSIHSSAESFSIPAPATIEVRRPPLYAEQQVAPSGPQAPSVAPPADEVIQYGEPIAKDPYHSSQESSDIPENLRHPERSFRPTPTNEMHSIATQSGIASEHTHVSSDNSQHFQQEMIQGGGEFMPGIFANDSFTDTSFSAF
jgi:hypothetical protein